MSETADDILTKPLGVAKPAGKRRIPALRVPARILADGTLFALLLAGTALALLGDPKGGEPHAEATIAIRDTAPATIAHALEPQSPEQGSGRSGRQSSAQQVENASGVTVTRAGGASAPEEAVIIRVPAPDPVRLAAAPDPRLVERGRHGPLPRMGEGRARPLDIYARPELPGAQEGPRIALVVSGVGIGDAATAAAIARLPPAISLALSPYGTEAEKTASRARQAGHEILLQVPMEPFDYPDSDPGPQTLLTTSRPNENMDRLLWALSRFPGIVGVVNMMGGKLTSDAASFEPVLKEVAARGLGYVDDGASPRSLALGLAQKFKTPTVRADIVVDSAPRQDAIDRELSRVEALARQKGLVVASASAQSLTIDRIALWARDLEARGFRLTPVSAALRSPSVPARVTSTER